MPKSAFTLIEMLVVLAILAILTSLAFGTLGVVRKMAESTNCLNNLRHMQLANIAYAQENRGYFVAVYHLFPGDQKANVWRANPAFLAYFTDDAVTNNNDTKVPAKLLCPTMRYAVRATNSGLINLELSYGYNTQNPNRTLGNVGPTIRSRASGSLITFLDALDFEITNFDFINPKYLTQNPPVPEGIFSQNTVAFRHKKNANVVLGDGSAFGRSHAVLRDRFPTSANNRVRYWSTM